jgi:hypothetical protein
MTEPEPAYALQPAGTAAIQPAHLMPEHTLLSLTRAMRKVKIKLTIAQLRTLAVIVQSYVSMQNVAGVDDLADLYDAYVLSEKLRGKMIGDRLNVNLSLKMNEARSLYCVLTYTEFAKFAVYEKNLALYIISVIDKQTV